MTITNITHGLQAITAQQSNRTGYKWHLNVYFTDISPSSSHGVHRQMVAAGASCSAGSGTPLASQHLSPYSSPDTFQYNAGTARVKQAYKNNTPPEPARKYLDNFFYRPIQLHQLSPSTSPALPLTMNHNITDVAPYQPLLPRLHSPTSYPKKKKSGIFPDLTKNINLGEDIDLVVGLTATALTADQVLKLKDSKKHKAMHLAKASLSAAAAATAFTMMKREHNERVGRERTRRRPESESRSTPSTTKGEKHECHSRSTSRSSSRPRSFERARRRSRSRDRELPYPDLEAQEPEDHKVRWALVPSSPFQEEHQEQRAESPEDYSYASSRLAPPPDERYHHRGRARTTSPLRRQDDDRWPDNYRHHHRRRKSEGESRWQTFFDLLGQELLQRRQKA